MSKKRREEQLRTVSGKHAMITALEKSLGVVATACKTIGISREQFYKWKKEDEDFAAKVDAISEIALDFAESKLFEKINGITVQKETKDGPRIYRVQPDIAAIIFLLKCRGKKRGYIERFEVGPPPEENPIKADDEHVAKILETSLAAIKFKQDNEK